MDAAMITIIIIIKLSNIFYIKETIEVNLLILITMIYKKRLTSAVKQNLDHEIVENTGIIPLLSLSLKIKN